jgi:hypothetical protein
MKPAFQIPESIHAILSPSKAHMWLACAAALGASKDKPNKPSKYAAEGTVYHDVSRRALIEDRPCADYIGDRYKVGEFEFIVDEANCEFAQVYVDLVRAIPGKRMVEVDLEYSALLGVPKTYSGEHVVVAGLPGEREAIAYSYPVAAGTSDIVVLDYENKIVWTIDLKFGRGDIVYASEAIPGTTQRKPNPQLALYAAAAVARYELLGIEDDWTAYMAISQPRAFHFDRHPMPVGELKAWVAAQKAAANEAYTLWSSPHLIDEGRFNPGEKQCRWCPLSGACPAQSNKILNMFPKTHAVEAIKTLPQLSDEDVAEALDRADEVEHWISAVRAEGLIRAMQGRVLPNWKLVQGRRGNRALPEDLDATRVSVARDAALTELHMEDVEAEAVELSIKDAVIFAVGDAAYKPREIKTVAQLEKALVKKAPLLWAALQQHITQSDGKPALERMEDPRPPLTVVGHEFPLAEPGKESLL